MRELLQRLARNRHAGNPTWPTLTDVMPEGTRRVPIRTSAALRGFVNAV